MSCKSVRSFASSGIEHLARFEDHLASHRIAKPALKHEIHRTPEYLLKLVPHRHQGKCAVWMIGGQLNQHVNVAVRTEIIAKHTAKNSELDEPPFFCKVDYPSLLNRQAHVHGIDLNPVSRDSRNYFSRNTCTTPGPWTPTTRFISMSAVLLGPILLKLNDTATVYVPIAQIAPAGLSTDTTKLDSTHKESLRGPQARDDAASYRTWHKTDAIGGPAGKYLVNDQGAAVWLVDPGINGTHSERPDGSVVRKFDAPKATLMSYIIKGILDRKLPWELVLLGVMIAVCLQLSFIPALAFAVGVYLPLSSSMPIFIGGMIRWLVDRKLRQKPAHAKLSQEEFTAESDKSPGVLLASGYIAGGAIAGIIIAFLAGVLGDFDTAVTKWSTANNPLFEGPNADLLTLIPFTALCVFLYFVAREKLLTPKKG